VSERARYEFLVSRDGEQAARAWCARTADIYAAAIHNPTHFASKKEWRSKFERSIVQLRALAASGRCA
jgi:hypothetical protein